MGRGEMGNGKLKRDEDLRMATCFENYRFLSLTQNGTNYKFIKKKSGTERLEKNRNNLAQILARNS